MLSISEPYLNTTSISESEWYHTVQSDLNKSEFYREKCIDFTEKCVKLTEKMKFQRKRCKIIS